MRRVLQVAFFFLFAALATPAAHATLAHTCFYTNPLLAGVSNPAIPWFSSGATVDIWYSRHYGGTAATDYRPWIAISSTEAQLQQVIIKAVGVWNEQSGSRIRLRYRGATDNYLMSQFPCTGGVCSVVVTGDMAGCPTSDTADSLIWLDATHRFQFGDIVFHQTNAQGGGCGHIIPWFVTTAGGAVDIDAVRTLIHEIGHTVFSMAHVDGSTPDCTDMDASGNFILSVMETQIFIPDKRNIKAWDKEVAQLRYGSRSSSATMQKAVPSGSSWMRVQVTGTTATRLLYRAFSLTEDLGKRVIGWLDGAGATQTFGTGAMNVSQYQAGLVASGVLTSSAGTSPEPIAIASQPQSYATPNVLYLYKGMTAGHEYSNDQNQICWKNSSNGGLNWPLSPTCASAYSSVHGLSATWVEGAASYIIVYVDTSTGGFKVTALVYKPSTGAVVKTALVDTSSNFVWSPTQPGIACQATGNTCLLAYAVDDTTGSLGWLTLTVNTSTLAVTCGALTTWATNVDDIPELAWDIDDSTYRLAKADKSSAVFSYKKTVAGSSWTGTGDIVNNGGGLTQISGAALSTRPVFSYLSRPYAWYSVYF